MNGVHQSFKDDIDRILYVALFPDHLASLMGLMYLKDIGLFQPDNEKIP